MNLFYNNELIKIYDDNNNSNNENNLGNHIFIFLLSLIIHAQIYICIEKYKILIMMMEIKNVLVRRSHKGQYNIKGEGRIELET